MKTQIKTQLGLMKWNFARGEYKKALMNLRLFLKLMKEYFWLNLKYYLYQFRTANHYYDIERAIKLLKEEEIIRGEKW